MRLAYRHLLSVMLFRPSGADAFRPCPACSSPAVSSVSHDDAGSSTDRWSARCGACGTRRTRVLAEWESRELLSWYASDRRCIQEALARSRWADPARELGLPPV
jgi:hypothetical protein